MTRLSAISLCLLLVLAPMVRGQEGWVSAHVDGKQSLWFTFNPQGAVDNQGLLPDVLSRCTPQRRQQMIRNHSDDLATQCHEASHMVNERIGLEYPQFSDSQAFYVGGGHCAVLMQPRISVSQVAQLVSPQYRDGIYFQTYLVQLSTNPSLFLLDEWTAACNGWEASKELRVSDTGDAMMARQFCHYADCYIEAVKRHDPNYAQMSELLTFVEWQKNRVAKLSGGAIQKQIAPAQMAQCFGGMCYESQGYTIERPTQQPPKPASFTDPRWIQWRAEIEAKVAAKATASSDVKNLINNTIENKLQGVECQCNGECVKRSELSAYDLKIQQITNQNSKLEQTVVNINGRLDGLDDQQGALDHETPIRVYLPDGRLVGEARTNLFRGGSIDLTFDPRALLDQQKQ